jgi:hypothetical protein
MHVRAIEKEVEHDPKTGQFTSANGYVGTMKSSSGKKYGIKTEKKKGVHISQFSGEPKKTMHTLYHVHDDEGNHIGHVAKYQTARYSHERRAVAHDGTKLGGSKVAHGNDTLDRERLHSLLRAVTDHHESKSKEKSITLGGLFTPIEKDITLGDLLAALATEAPGEDEVEVAKLTNGSIENMLGAIRGPVIMGSGCSNPPPYLPNGERDYNTPMDAAPSGVEGAKHYCSVAATFTNYAYVNCSDERRMWKVPYELLGDGTVKCGTPEEVVSVYKPVSAVTEGDDLDEGGGAAKSVVL